VGHNHVVEEVVFESNQSILKNVTDRVVGSGPLGVGPYLLPSRKVPYIIEEFPTNMQELNTHMWL
jgi:hypothetical protein